MEKFEIIRELGVGIQGRTLMVIEKDMGEVCCLKEIECLNNDRAQEIFEEINFTPLNSNQMKYLTDLLQLNKVNVVTPFCLFVHWEESITSFFFYQMLPYFDQGNFEDLMNMHNESKEPISEESIKCWLGQSIKIFQYLASKNVVHRCVRPSNFMLDEDQNVHLVDICSEIVEKDIRGRTRGKTGCLTFAAPEIVVKNSNHDTASDFWSLGGVFLGLMTCHKKTCEEYGSYLIEFKFNEKALSTIFEDIAEDYSVNLRDTMKRIIMSDLKERLTLEKVMHNDLLREIIEEEARKEELLINGVLVPLDLNQPFEYYTQYMLRHYKSRSSFKQVLLYFDENINENRSLFAFDSDSLCDFLVYLVHHIDSLEICEIGMKIIGIQVYGLQGSESFFSKVPITQICKIAKRYPLSFRIQYATARVFVSTKKNESMRKTLNDLRGSEILMAMLDNFTEDLLIIIHVLQSMWPMLLFDANVQDFYEQGACSKVASIIKMYHQNAEVFEAASMVVFGLSLSDLNVVELNKCNTIYLLLIGLYEHQNDPDIIINTCNAISSMVDAEEECAYGMTQKITDDVNAIPFIGSLMRMHIEKYEVVESICKVFKSLTKLDDIVSEMKCSDVYEDVKDIKYAYLDFWDFKKMCDAILDRVNNLKPLVS